MIGKDLSKVIMHQSQYEVNKENPTTFTLGVLDAEAEAHIEDSTTSFERSSSKPNDPVFFRVNIHLSKRLAVQFGLKGFENFIDPKTGEPIEFKTKDARLVSGETRKVVCDEILNMIPKKVIMELADIIEKEGN